MTTNRAHFGWDLLQQKLTEAAAGVQSTEQQIAVREEELADLKQRLEAHHDFAAAIQIDLEMLQRGYREAERNALDD